MSVINLCKATLLITLLSVTSFASAGPDIQHWQTSNGARVFYVHAPELPIIDLQVVFDAGSARDGKKEGLAALTSSLLDEGTGKRNADAVAERFEGVGAQFAASSLRDMAIMSLRTLTEKNALDTSLDMFANIMVKPSFPEKSFERNRKAMLVGLQVARQRPGDIANKTFFRNLYQQHPYAIDGAGTEASLMAMQRKDVVDFHKRYYVANNAVIAIVGAVSKQQAKAVAERITNGLAAGKKAAPLAVVRPIKAAQNIRIDHQSSQTHILVGQPGMHRGDPDYFSLYVGNHILGGSGLVSRLSAEIREKRGLVYSVYSYFTPMREDGPFTMGLQTKNESADEALKILNQSLKQFLAKGPTEEELKSAKQNITGGFALRVDSNKKITQYVAMIGFYGLPLNYLDMFNQQVEAVTVKSIRDAFNRRIKPDQLVTVMVGGKAKK